MTTGIRAGANASDTRLSIVAETAWGTTPATPAFTNARFTGESLQWSKATVRSEEIRPDRNVVDEIQTGRSAAGGVDFELSYGTFDKLIAGLMFSDWDDDVIKNGADEGTAFTLERTLSLAAGVKEYQRYVGMVVNTMSLSITAAQLVTGSFGLMGKFGGRGTTPIAGATYVESPQNHVVNAATDFASLKVGDGSIVPLVQSITIDITNNLRTQEAVGSLDAVGIGTGRFEATGSMEVYFSSGDLLQAFLDHDDISLEFTLGTETGKRYKFNFPTIKLVGDPGSNATSNDSDVMLTLNFTAVLDRLTAPTPIGATLEITRAVA